MRGIIQRVHNACVYSDGQCTGSIEQGLLIYVCFSPVDETLDSHKIFSKFAQKCTSLRIFCDENNKINKSVLNIGGAVLLVPNFTLYAQYTKGTRPQFSSGLAYEKAQSFFESTVVSFASLVETISGTFGSSMKVDSSADGPVNMLMDIPHREN